MGKLIGLIVIGLMIDDWFVCIIIGVEVFNWNVIFFCVKLYRMSLRDMLFFDIVIFVLEFFFLLMIVVIIINKMIVRR